MKHWVFALPLVLAAFAQGQAMAEELDGLDGTDLVEISGDASLDAFPVRRPRPGGGHGGGGHGGHHGGGHGGHHGGHPGGGHGGHPGGGHGGHPGGGHGGHPGGGHGGHPGGGHPGGGHGGHHHPHPIPVPVPVPTPVPTPVPSACGYLQGYYSGICRASAGTSAIAFSVYTQGGVCVAGSSNLFNPVILGVNGTAGYASNLSGIGVAINNTNLQVFGAGRFSFTGYNYAGNFWFTCSN